MLGSAASYLSGSCSFLDSSLNAGRQGMAPLNQRDVPGWLVARQKRVGWDERDRTGKGEGKTKNVSAPARTVTGRKESGAEVLQVSFFIV